MSTQIRSKYMFAELDLLIRSMWESRSSADPTGRLVTLGGVVVMLAASSLGTRGVTDHELARSDLVLMEVLPSPRRTRC